MLILAPVQFAERIFFCIPGAQAKTPVPGPNDCMWTSDIVSFGNMVGAWSVWYTESLGYMLVGLPMFLIFFIIYMINLAIDALHSL